MDTGQAAPDGRPYTRASIHARFDARPHNSCVLADGGGKLMGALRARATLTEDNGVPVKDLSDIYIWRTDHIGSGPVDDATFEYYATRVPPAHVDRVEDMMTLTGKVVNSSVTTPHVKFMHRYNDGAELCIARAIIALQEAGMNV